MASGNRHSRQGLPRVVAHLAVSLDGSTTGFQPDVAKFYELAATWREDVTLVGADTLLAQEEVLASAPRPGPAPDGPLLAVTDSGARVRQWGALREAGHWSDVVALRSERTPPRPEGPEGEGVEEWILGRRRVDLGAALRELARRHGARTVRVDSGGTLVGALLEAGLLTEVSLLLHPCLVGTDGSRPWYGPGGRRAAGLTLVAGETLDGGLVWLRYGTAGPAAAG
ncbi:dihydrofolate reductase family protein [Streptomyces sp. WMMB 714]|uniref:dihydrofolate reductase family protein n=1 Tax=Streptomyces sp. WMMB 714 TaxID=1286822 RepID=UPI0005F791AF|nr:dihydrofolate reductase family protein [Streptomyces sp. WMMB 714]